MPVAELMCLTPLEVHHAVELCTNVNLGNIYDIQAAVDNVVITSILRAIRPFPTRIEGYITFSVDSRVLISSVVRARYLSILTEHLAHNYLEGKEPGGYLWIPVFPMDDPITLNRLVLGLHSIMQQVGCESGCDG